MKFLIDNHLPSALVPWLKGKKHEALHVRDLQFNQAQDIVIWNYAVQHNFIIMTKDEDFATLSLLQTETTPVIWLRLGNCRKIVLFAALETVWSQIDQKLAAGEQIIEVY